MFQVRAPFVAPLSVIAVFAALGVSACGGSPAPKSTAQVDEKQTCVGGFCLKPDHVIARKVTGTRGRCLIIAWDGNDSLPPTAKVGAVDEAPGARPGVFAAIDLPSLRDGFSYPIAADLDGAQPGAASVFAVRVDPGVRFADQRIADGGDVKIVASGSERILVVKAQWDGGKKTETASFVIPKAYNGCTSPADLP